MLRRTDKFIFLIIFGLLLFLNFNRHSKHGSFNYHGELFADKAGYQVFLPALLYYDFDASQFPEDMDWKTGTGFKLDSVNNKVLTKYPIGVSIMELPFFMIGVGIDAIKGTTKDLGYTPVQHKMIGVSTIFYAVLGLLLLFIAFGNSYKPNLKYLFIFLLLFGSNFFYYVTRDAGLSHAYSFFIFTALFYLLKHFFEGSGSLKSIVLIGILMTLGCLIRPINVLFLTLASLVFILPHWKILVHKKKDIIKGILISIPFCAVLILPQLLYYNYAFGDFLAYSYNDERFLYLLNPKFARVWFAPANGLLLYSPIFLIVIIGLIQLWKFAKTQVLMMVLLFFSISYLYASWWTPGLGCGYGHRGFIEFLPFFSIPVLFNLNTWKRKFVYYAAGLLGLLYIIVLVYFLYKYDGCWYGNGYWDWNEILLILNFK